MSYKIETIDKNPKSCAAWKREAERLQAIIDSMALAAMDSEPVALHMGEAINVFNSLKVEQLSERVNNAGLGPMGASNVQVWTSKAGGRLEFISANGGCTLNIFPQPAPAVPGKLIPVSERMPIEFEAVIALDGDQVYGEAMYSYDDGFTIDGYEPWDRVQLQSVTHWMPLPAAPQEVQGE